MNLHQTIINRRTIHDYLTTPLPEGALQRALEAAIRAPNHKLTNPWRFTLMGPRTRHAITELAVTLKSKGKAPSEPGEQERQQKIRTKFNNPPEILAVSQVIAKDEFRRREDYGACACAIQNIMLSLASEGIGTKWSSGDITSHAETYELLGVDPETEEIIGFVWIGYPESSPETGRKPLSEVCRQTL